MNPIRTIRRLAYTLAGLAATTLAFAGAAPAALARPAPPGPDLVGIVPDPAPAIRTVVIGGMPGWQITLIAAGAAALAAVLALLLARAWAARRHALAPSA
jgi:hypothetical protein